MSKTILYNPNSPGSPESTEQPIRYGFSPQRGYFTIREWRGTKAGVEAVANSLAGGNWSWEIEGGAVYKLRATLASDDVGGGAENPTTTWELLPNRVEKDILESALVQSLVTNTEIDRIKTAIEGNTTPLSITSGSNAEDLYNNMHAGQKSAVVFQPTLHKSQLVSRSYPVRAAVTNVGRIYSTATLTSQEGIPNTILFNLPNDTSPTDDIAPRSRPRMRYGWLKNYPTVQQVSFEKFQVSQTWEYGLWSFITYGEPL